MQLLTFLLNGVKFGIPVNDVESIETRMNVVNIPNSLPQVHGIMNLHGEVSVQSGRTVSLSGTGNQQYHRCIHEWYKDWA